MTAGEPAISLEELGWDDFFADEFRKTGIPDAVPARIITQQKSLCTVRNESGEMTATIAGRLRFKADNSVAYPVVGDWAAVTPRPDEGKGIIRAILPRRSSFSRQVAGVRQRLGGGQTQEQVVAANIDTVFLVSGLDGGRNLNLRRMERYLTLAWNSGARPVIVLNKIDLCPDIVAAISEAVEIAPGVPVHAVSATERTGLEELDIYITKGSTVALLGQSGVGKSAIINALLGVERLKVGDIRASDHKGRHTTTHRELILLPGGGAVIDTPGMREIQVRGDEGGLRDAFEDIESLAGLCRFSDCRHENEPGCAVREAIERGTLDPARFRSYRKLQRELRHVAMRESNGIRLEEKLRWKRISQMAKRIRKEK
jgi:ribosome biogenesis GTPase